MEALIIFLVLFLMLDIAALRWGADSREGVNSSEWEHRRLRGSFV